MEEHDVFKHVKCLFVFLSLMLRLGICLLVYTDNPSVRHYLYFPHLSYFKIQLIYFVLFITLFTLKIMFFLDYALQSYFFFKEMFNSIQLLKLSQLLNENVFVFTVNYKA